MKRRSITFVLVFLLLLTACGTKNNTTEQSNQEVPTPVATSTAQPDIATEQPVQGLQLPGRLLFVKEGTIWMWEGTRAFPWLGSGSYWQPEWSSDGTRVAYIERGESYSNIRIADAQGKSIAQLTKNDSSYPSRSHERIYDTMWALYPTWSPGNRRITVVTQYSTPVGSPALEYTLSIYSLSANGGGARRFIYADDIAHCGTMTYFPSSASSRQPRYELVFTRINLRPEGPSQIYRLNLAKEESLPQPFPGMPLESYDPSFSPDGAWLAFAARKEGKTDVWVLPGQAEDESMPTPIQLTDMGSARAPVFSPDGSMLAFLAIPPNGGSFELWVADLGVAEDGTIQLQEPHQLTQNMSLDPDSGLSWASDAN